MLTVCFGVTNANVQFADGFLQLKAFETGGSGQVVGKDGSVVGGGGKLPASTSDDNDESSASKDKNKRGGRRSKKNVEF
jgi:hypothetical protein